MCEILIKIRECYEKRFVACDLVLHKFYYFIFVQLCVLTLVYPGQSVVSAKHPPFLPAPSSCLCLTGHFVCTLAPSSVVCDAQAIKKEHVHFKKYNFNAQKSCAQYIPLLKFHHDFLHLLHLLLQLHSLRLFFFCLSFRVLKSHTG